MSANKVTGLLFPGQGSQFVGMGRDLYESQPIARAYLDDAEKIIGGDLKRIMFEGPSEDLQRTRVAQPAIFALSAACFEVLKTLWPSAVQDIRASAGLSLGEATALAAAGVFLKEDALRFVKNRGQYMDEASLETPGAMAAILGLDLAAAEEVCQLTGAEIGNLNAPGQIVISGAIEAVERAMAVCKERGARRTIRLEVSGGFHSSCMNSACQRLEVLLRDMELRRPAWKVYSNLTAESEFDPSAIKLNLVRQMNHRTLWELTIQHMIRDGVERFIELGPGSVLKGLVKKINPQIEVISIGTTDDLNLLPREGAAI